MDCCIKFCVFLVFTRIIFHDKKKKISRKFPGNVKNIWMNCDKCQNVIAKKCTETKTKNDEA